MNTNDYDAECTRIAKEIISCAVVGDMTVQKVMADVKSKVAYWTKHLAEEVPNVEGK